VSTTTSSSQPDLSKNFLSKYQKVSEIIGFPIVGGGPIFLLETIFEKYGITIAEPTKPY
jgi:hypothetical protein